MSMPFYVAPEQVMKDRADYARKGIARGRGLVALDLRRRHRHRGREPVATPAQGQRDLRPHRLRRRRQYNEFDQLRVAGVRAADLKGYQYSRDDVDARSLANQYAQILGQVFTHEMKPMEVEILVAEVGQHAGRRPALPHPLRRHRDGRARTSACSAARPTPSPQRIAGGLGARASTWPRRVAARPSAPGRSRPHARRRRPRGGRAGPQQRPALLPPPRRRRGGRAPRPAPEPAGASATPARPIGEVGRGRRTAQRGQHGRAPSSASDRHAAPTSAAPAADGAGRRRPRASSVVTVVRARRRAARSTASTRLGLGQVGLGARRRGPARTGRARRRRRAAPRRCPRRPGGRRRPWPRRRRRRS